MSELKMSEVFWLPLKLDSPWCGICSGEKQVFEPNYNFYPQWEIESKAAIEAINSYDIHVKQIANLTKDVEVLRGAVLLMMMTLNGYSNPPPAVKKAITVLEKALSETEPSN